MPWLVVNVELANNRNGKWSDEFEGGSGDVMGKKRGLVAKLLQRAEAPGTCNQSWGSGWSGESPTHFLQLHIRAHVAVRHLVLTRNRCLRTCHTQLWSGQLMIARFHVWAIVSVQRDHRMPYSRQSAHRTAMQIDQLLLIPVRLRSNCGIAFRTQLIGSCSVYFVSCVGVLGCTDQHAGNLRELACKFSESESYSRQALARRGHLNCWYQFTRPYGNRRGGWVTGGLSHPPTYLAELWVSMGGFVSNDRPIVSQPVTMNAPENSMDTLIMWGRWSNVYPLASSITVENKGPDSEAKKFSGGWVVV